MPRPKASPEQQVQAFRYWNRKFSVRSIRKHLVDVYGEDSVSTGTIGNWVKGFKDGDDLSKGIDEPFRWYRMSEFGIPDEAGDTVLKVASRLADYGNEPTHILGFDDGLTFREAKWAWKVYEAVGGRVDLDPEVMSDNRAVTTNEDEIEKFSVRGVIDRTVERAYLDVDCNEDQLLRILESLADAGISWLSFGPALGPAQNGRSYDHYVRLKNDYAVPEAMENDVIRALQDAGIDLVLDTSWQPDEIETQYGSPSPVCAPSRPQEFTTTLEREEQQREEADNRRQADLINDRRNAELLRISDGESFEGFLRRFTKRVQQESVETTTCVRNRRPSFLSHASTDSDETQYGSPSPVCAPSRSIGRVGLLTAADERFLARGMEISQRLSEVQGGMAERTGHLPTGAETTLELLKRLGAQSEVAIKIASYVGLPHDLTLGTLLGTPELRQLIDGPDDETLLAYLSDAFNCELQQAQDMVKDLSIDSALIALESLDALDSDPNLDELANNATTKVYRDKLEVYEFLFAAHFSRIRDNAERSERHLSEANRADLEDENALLNNRVNRLQSHLEAFTDKPDGSGLLGWAQYVSYVRHLSFAEKARKIGGITLDMTHIEKELAYRPWESEVARNRYETARSEGLVHDPDSAPRMVRPFVEAREELTRSDGVGISGSQDIRGT